VKVDGVLPQCSYLRKYSPLSGVLRAFIRVTGLPVDTPPGSARLLRAEKSLRRIDTIWSLILLSESRHMLYDTLIYAFDPAGVPLTYNTPLIET